MIGEVGYPLFRNQIGPIGPYLDVDCAKHQIFITYERGGSSSLTHSVWLIGKYYGHVRMGYVAKL